jgi:hypothetical protein
MICSVVDSDRRLMDSPQYHGSMLEMSLFSESEELLLLMLAAKLNSLMVLLVVVSFQSYGKP